MSYQITSIKYLKQLSDVPDKNLLRTSSIDRAEELMFAGGNYLGVDYTSDLHMFVFYIGPESDLKNPQMIREVR
jgi:hypothetical protein